MGPLEIAGIVVGLGMLGCAALCTLIAALRTRAAERAVAPGPGGPGRPYADGRGVLPGGAPGYLPLQPPWPRPDLRHRKPAGPGLWAGATVTAVAGFAMLVAGVGSALWGMSGGDRMVVTPANAGGLQRDDDPERRASLDRQREHLRDAGVPNPTVAFYRRPDGAGGGVAFAGGWGRIPDPSGTLRRLLLVTGGSFGADPWTHTYPSGPSGGEVMCVSGGSVDGEPLPICGWANRSTIGLVMARDESASRCAELLRRMRGDMERARG